MFYAPWQALLPEGHVLRPMEEVHKKARRSIEHVLCSMEHALLHVDPVLRSILEVLWSIEHVL